MKPIEHLLVALAVWSIVVSGCAWYSFDLRRKVTAQHSRLVPLQEQVRVLESSAEILAVEAARKQIHDIVDFQDVEYQRVRAATWQAALLSTLRASGVQKLENGEFFIVEGNFAALKARWSKVPETVSVTWENGRLKAQLRSEDQ